MIPHTLPTKLQSDVLAGHDRIRPPFDCIHCIINTYYFMSVVLLENPPCYLPESMYRRKTDVTQSDDFLQKS